MQEKVEDKNFILGKQALQNGNAHQAFELFSKALKAYLKSNNVEQASASWDNLVISAFEIHHPLAVQYAKEALNYAVQSKQPYGTIMNRLALAEASTKLESKRYIESAIASWAFDELNGEVRALFCLRAGIIMEKWGETQHAVQIFELAVPDKGRFVIQDFKNFLNLLFEIASRLKQLGRLESCLRMFQIFQVDNLPKECENLRLGALVELINIQNECMMYPEAQKTANEAIELAKSLKDSDKLAAAYNNLGNNLLETGEYEKAITCFEIAENLCKELCDEIGRGQALGNLGLAFLRHEHLEMAASTLRKAESIFAKNNDNLGLARNHGNISLLKFRTNDIKGFFHEIRISLKYYRRSGSEYGIIDCLLDIATGYLRLKNFSRVNHLCTLCKNRWKNRDDQIYFKIRFIQIRSDIESLIDTGINEEKYRELLETISSLSVMQRAEVIYALAFMKARLAIYRENWKDVEKYLNEATVALEPWCERFEKESNLYPTYKIMSSTWAMLVQVYCKEIQDRRRALECLEKYKCRVFLRLLGNVNIKAPTGIPVELINKEQSLRSEIRRCIISKEPQVRLNLSELRKELSGAYKEIRSLGLEQAAYADLREGKPANLNEIRKLLSVD